MSSLPMPRWTIQGGISGYIRTRASNRAGGHCIHTYINKSSFNCLPYPLTIMINVVISIILLALPLPSAVSVPTTPPACSRFFDLTVENFHSSGVSEAYSAWVKKASARPEFTDVGEVSLFFQDHGFRDVECGVTWLGCKNAPSCESIRDAFAGNDEEARRVYFVSQIVQNIALIAGLVYVSFPFTFLSPRTGRGFVGLMSHRFKADDYRRPDRHLKYHSCCHRDILLATRCEECKIVCIYRSSSKGHG